MPTFTPPTTDGNLMYDPDKVDTDPAHRLARYYGAWETGQTVWKDSHGAWHTDLVPYLGGATQTTHDWDHSTVDGPDEGLATAQEVYLGGHVYDVTDAKATELRAAGFFVGGHWEVEEQRWVDFALTSVPNKEYKGGDACASLDRGGGQSLWTFSDNLIGTLQPNGLYASALPTPNALFSRTGNVLSQVFPGGTPPAWPNPTGANKWWPVDLINDGPGTTGGVIILTTEATGILTLLRNELLVLNGLGGVDHSVELEVPRNDFFIQGIYKDDAAGFHYILGQQPGPSYQTDLYNQPTYSKIARVPIGQLEIVANWRYWDGTTWHADQTRATRFVDDHGDPLNGMVDLTRVGSTYVLAHMRTRAEAVHCYRSPNPQGPWTRYYSADVYKPPQAGFSPPLGEGFLYYLPKFHEYLSPDANHLVLSFSRNLIGVSMPLSVQHVSAACPLFVYVPPPT